MNDQDKTKAQLIKDIQKLRHEYDLLNASKGISSAGQLIPSEKRIADLVESLSLSLEVSTAGSWDWDILSNTFYWSDEFLKLFGMLPDTVPGFESWCKSLHPDDVETASKKIQDAIDEKTDLLQEYRIVLPDGILRWIRASGKVTYQNDIPIRMVGLCIDITEQKQYENSIKKTTASLKSLLDNRDDSIWSLDRNYNYIIFNEPYAKAFLIKNGFKVKTRMNSLKLLTNEAQEFWKSKYEPVFEGKKVVFEFIHNINGSDHYFQTFLNPIITDEIVTGASALSMDITERKQAEEELIKAKEKAEENETRFKAISEEAMDGIALTDINGNYVFINPAFCKMLGYSEKELLSMNVMDLKPPDIEAKQMKIIKKHGINYNYKFQFLIKNN